ncbi:cysteine--tRNA ligase [Candidatus Roizmanbacteria bacterium CG03_land_8_20_14_0_80_39_12]|uniref:Cysteine--tRNA ligase n=2 Tax=Candidatus Roizmaniibacteriota TaxID=1752723 RepID=A0A2M7BT53_9BACT|nr:MAG: cysteine--tRNA ligase [Candidatus Roizmanbacteria bacterium CG03_land_8_20_14_0_80_39_12]
MKLYNTLTRTLEEFKPIEENHLSLYTCGPTVYDFTHIGHIRAYVFNDTLRRTLEYLGYNVKHVMNITDVGHLSDDADQGEDKMEKGARKYGKTVWDIAKFYTDFFFMSMDTINNLRPKIVCKATDHIPEMITMIEALIKKGHAYETKEAVYFDVASFKEYGKLSGQKGDEKKQGTRDDIYVDPEKKHPADFALWFKRVGKFKDHTMHWESPWGNGFPGWHIECSAMSVKYLGKTIDIHTGGIDHIPVHHENEIAQSEAANGVQFVHYWMHYHFLQVEGQKMSKSLGNFFTIKDITKRGIHPMAFRLLLLQSHYRQPMNFTWVSVESVNEAYKKMKKYISELKKNPDEEKIHSVQEQKYKHLFIDAISNDLQTSIAIATLWTMLKDSQIPDFEKRTLVEDFDKVLGLNLLKEEKATNIPQEIIDLAQQRKQAKAQKEYAKADELRKQMEEKGYKIEDVKDGYKLRII